MGLAFLWLVMTRIEKVGLMCCVLVSLALAACSPEAIARWLGGPYLGQTTTYNVCLYADPGANQLMPNVACDLKSAGAARSYAILGGDNAGTDQDGEPCGFDFAHDQPVPVNGSSFQIEDQSPDGADEFTVNGTLDGDTATGTSTKMTGTSRCAIEWRATHVNGGTGGTGGSGGAGGDCVPSVTVGGTEQNPVIWEESYTCVDNSNTCQGEEDERITLALIQNGKDIEWEIVGEGDVGQGSKFFGELCGTSFKWSSKEGTAKEDGCWEFTTEGFNKRSVGPSFKCVGIGSRGADSTPTAAPTCAELATANVDYEACPPAPPASPI